MNMLMESNEETARRLLYEMSESLDIDSRKLARVEGQFITPNGIRSTKSGSAAGLRT